MKTPEEKAKAYDRAVEQAEKEILACGSLNCDAASLIFRLFPDLKESEDEMIRKQLINICNEWLSGGPSARPCLNDVRWLKNLLEKQEQKPAMSRETTLHQLFQNGSITLSDYLYLTEEQKSAWSEEDEAIVKFYEDDCNHRIGNMPMKDVVEMRLKFKEWITNRIKFLRPQPKQEWSEEDKETIRLLIGILKVNHPNGKFKTTEAGAIDVKYISTDEVISRLESLCPCPSWKPSKEQMGVFHNTMQRLLRAGGTGKWYAILESLYNQLEKL